MRVCKSECVREGVCERACVCEGACERRFHFYPITREAPLSKGNSIMDSQV